MPDSSLDISYTIDTVTVYPNNTTTIAFTLSHEDTEFSKSYSFDVLSTELTDDVTSDMTDEEKQETIQSNFANLANHYFVLFAKLVRNQQAYDDADLLDDLSGIISGLSIGALHSYIAQHALEGHNQIVTIDV